MSGIENAFVAIAAETFGLRRGRASASPPGDTASAPYGGVAGGSKVTYTYGRAIERAAEEARGRLLAVAAQELEIAPEDLEIADGEVRPVGCARPRHRDRRPRGQDVHVRQPARADRGLRRRRAGQPRARRRRAPLPRAVDPRHRRACGCSPTWSPRTSARRSTRRWSRARCTAAPPRASAGRCSRSCRTTRTASCKAATFAEYALPSTDQVPPIETLIVEVPAPDGPFGAKGVGEPPVCGGSARDRQRASPPRPESGMSVLPMTPVRVWAQLQSPAVV